MNLKNLLPFVFFLCVLPNQNTAQTKISADKNGGKITVTDFIVYDVLIHDPAVLSMDSSVAFNMAGWQYSTLRDYQENNEFKYFNLAQSRVFRQQMRSILRQPKVVFFKGNKILKSDELGNAITRSVFIAEWDSLGEITGEKELKDTISLKRWSKITFMEEWNLNTENGMLEKKVMAYTVSYFDEEKEIWRELFGVAADRMTFEKLRTNYLEWEN